MMIPRCWRRHPVLMRLALSCQSMSLRKLLTSHLPQAKSSAAGGSLVDEVGWIEEGLAPVVRHLQAGDHHLDQLLAALRGADQHRARQPALVEEESPVQSGLQVQARDRFELAGVL